jgi:hypothetical protein
MGMLSSNKQVEEFKSEILGWACGAIAVAEHADPL